MSLNRILFGIVLSSGRVETLLRILLFKSLLGPLGVNSLREVGVKSEFRFFQSIYIRLFWLFEIIAHASLSDLELLVALLLLCFLCFLFLFRLRTIR